MANDLGLSKLERIFTGKPDSATSVNLRSIPVKYVLMIPFADGRPVHWRFTEPTVTTTTTTTAKRWAWDKYDVGTMALKPATSPATSSGKTSVPAIADGVFSAIVPWTAELQLDMAYANTVTLTQAMAVVERHRAGVRVWNGALSGIVGPVARQEAYGGQPPMTSDEMIAREITVGLLAKMSELVERAVRDNEPLHLYALDEGFFLEIVPQRMSIQRALDTKMMERFTLGFRGISRVTPPSFEYVKASLPDVEDTWQDKLAKALEKGEHALEFMRDGLMYASEAVNAAAETIRAASDYVEGLANILLDGMQAVSDALNGLTDSIAWIVQLPIRLWHRLQRVINGFETLVARWRNLVDSKFGYAALDGDDVADGIEGTLQWTVTGPVSTPESTAGRAVALLSAQMAAEDAVDQQALQLLNLDAQQLGGVRHETVRRGDSIESIAFRATGDAGNWMLIAKENGLAFPYVSDTGLSGTVAPGDRVAIPSSLLPGNSMALPDAIPDDKLFGTNIALGPDGDLVLTSEDAADDVALVSGRDNVELWVRMTMQTERGTNPLYPEVGLPASVGSAATAEKIASYAVAASWTLRSDDRVADVRGLNVTDEGNAIGLRADVVLIDSRTIPVAAGGAR